MDGKIAGVVGYGYAVESSGDRSIDPEQPLVVNRILSMYADEVSPRTIAKVLNDEDVAGPKGNIWKDTTIRGQCARGVGLLNNEAYIGRLIYVRTAYVKNPKSGRRVAMPHPEDVWIVTEMSELRIIDHDLWQRVKERQEANTIVMPRDGDNRALNHKHRKAHAWSGALACGCCGAPIAIKAKDRYGCPAYRASRTSKNKRTVPRTEIEQRVILGLQRNLLDAKYLDAFTAEFQQEVDRLRNTNPSELAARKERLTQVTGQIDRIVEHIMNGTGRQSMTDTLGDLEVEQESLEAEVSQREARTTVVPIRNIG